MEEGRGLVPCAGDCASILGAGAVYVAEQESVFAASDDTLSGRSSADEFPLGHKRLPLQLAGMFGGVFDGDGLLPLAGRR